MLEFWHLECWPLDITFDGRVRWISFISRAAGDLIASVAKASPEKIGQIVYVSSVSTILAT